MISRKSRKTSAKNKHNNRAATRKKPVSTSKVSTSTDRIDIRIPKKSKIYEYLYVDNPNDPRPKWQRLDAIYASSQVNKDLYAQKVIDDFLRDISELLPDKKADFADLRPLILKQIIMGIPLDKEYFEHLKKLGLRKWEPRKYDI